MQKGGQLLYMVGCDLLQDRMQYNSSRFATPPCLAGGMALKGHVQVSIYHEETVGPEKEYTIMDLDIHDRIR